MTNPVIALLWVCLRITRRWYGVELLIASAIAVALAYFFSNAILKFVPAGAPVIRRLNDVQLAPLGGLFIQQSIFLFALASFAALSAISIGNKEGFPFRYQFGLPISTSMLVIVPMLYLCVICASLYFIPAITFGLLLDVPMPIATPTAMLGVMAAIFVASSWSTTSTLGRGLGLLFSITVVIMLLDQFRAAKFVEGEVPSVDSVALTGVEYLLLLLVFIMLLAFVIRSVSRQRCGESSSPPGGRMIHAGAAANSATVRSPSSPGLLDRLTDAFTYPCPVNSVIHAEMWLEMKRYGTPIIVIGLGIAVVVPALTWLSVMLNRPTIAQVMSIAPLFMFFAALGISIFNRRLGNRGYMNNFEGTRAMSTVRLASIQLLVLAGTTLISIIVIGLSLWISQTLFSSAGLQIGELMSWWTGSTLSMRAASLFMTLILYLTAITLFASLHSGSVLWRKKFLVGTLLVIFYAIYFTVRVKIASDKLAVTAMRPNFNMIGDISILDRMDEHMWGFAICTLLLMLAAVGRTLYLKLFTLQSGSAVMLLWLGFLLCSYVVLEGMDIHLSSMAPELLVFNCALLALPLTLFLVTVCSYDKLRHG